jgi:hypothetical protein
MVVICATRAAAGQVITLLLRYALFPRTHFRVDETDYRDTSITITIFKMPSAEQLGRLHLALAATPNSHIQ